MRARDIFSRVQSNLMCVEGIKVCAVCIDMHKLLEQLRYEGNSK